MTNQSPPPSGGKHCTYAVDGYTIECYNLRPVVEIRTPQGVLIARLCVRHYTPGARRAAEDMGFVQIEL